MSLLHKLCRVTVQTNVYALRRQLSLTPYTFTASSSSSGDQTSLGDVQEPESSTSKGGFARAFEKYTAPPTPAEEPVDNQSFASLLRQSKFIDVSNGENDHMQDHVVYVIFAAGQCRWKSC